MPGRHQLSSIPRSRLRSVVGLGLSGLLALGIILGFTFSASGAPVTVKAQLTLSGLANASNPLGGSQIGVHPGDSVQISPSTAPTAGLDQLGLGGLLSGLLNGLASFQVTADFSHLPGGRANTVISTKTSPITFTFPNTGTYNFTWSAQQVGLLGGLIPIDLDGNQLAKAGIKLNAANQYVGQIVVAKNPPPGHLGLQVPSLHVAPSLPIVGQLPTLSLPGVTVTVPVTLPSLPGLGGGSGSSTAPAGGGHPGGSTGGGLPNLGGVIPVPAQVVPGGGGGGGVAGDGGGGGGFQALPLPNVAGAGNALSSRSATASGAGKSLKQRPASKDSAVNLAANRSSTGQLSVVLAIIAVIALSLVAATYARLYFLRRS